MSGKRMVHDTLFSSENMSELPIDGRYLYIATIVHADDEGRMRADPKFLKLKAFPFDNHTVDKVRTLRNQLSTKGIITIYQVSGKEYLFHPNWEKWQTLRKDRKKPSDCPAPDNQVSTKWQPMVTQGSKEVKEVTEGSKVTSSSASGFAASPPPSRETAVKAFEEARDNELCGPPKNMWADVEKKI